MIAVDVWRRGLTHKEAMMSRYFEYKWAAIVAVSELVDGQFEIEVQNPHGGPALAVETFNEGDDPEKWVASILGKWLRGFVTEYHERHRRTSDEDEMVEAMRPAGFAQGYVNEVGEPLMSGEAIRYEQYLDSQPSEQDPGDFLYEDFDEDDAYESEKENA